MGTSGWHHFTTLQVGRLLPCTTPRQQDNLEGPSIVQIRGEHKDVQCNRAVLVGDKPVLLPLSNPWTCPLAQTLSHSPFQLCSFRTLICPCTPIAPRVIETSSSFNSGNVDVRERGLSAIPPQLYSMEQLNMFGQKTHGYKLIGTMSEILRH